MWTYRTIWNICISDFIAASLWINGFFSKNLMLTFTKMCAISQMNEYSNKLHIWTNKMFDCQHASPPSCPVYIAEQCKTIGKTPVFSFIGSLSHADEWHHCTECRGYVCSPSPARPVRTSASALSSSEPRWPLTPPSRLQQSEWSCWRHLQSVKSAQLWFLKFVHATSCLS